MSCSKEHLIQNYGGHQLSDDPTPSSDTASSVSWYTNFSTCPQVALLADHAVLCHFHKTLEKLVESILKAGARWC